MFKILLKNIDIDNSLFKPEEENSLWIYQRQHKITSNFEEKKTGFLKNMYVHV